MDCPLCRTPVMLHALSGYYCPNLDCSYNNIFDEPEKSYVEAYEIVRRQRDGDAYAGMPDEERMKLLGECNKDIIKAHKVWAAAKK